jgi:hypothetical protein
MAKIPKIQFTSQLKLMQVRAWNEENAYRISLGVVPKLVWVNPIQMTMLKARQKTQLYQLGRGSGKSTMSHFSMAQRLESMPRGSFFFAAPTLNQMLSFSLKGLEESWDKLGWERGRDYVMFSKPPSNWEKPYNAPLDYKQTICHRKGGYYQLLSARIGETRRGGSYSGGDGDEIAWVKKTFIEDVIIPSMRGEVEHFGNHPLYGVIRWFTSMPKDPSGYWIFDVEKQYKAESIEKQGVTTDYLYVTGNIYDNIEAAGKENVARMKAEMTHLKFQREVMNVRVFKAEKGFYPKFNALHHTRSFGIGWYFDRETGMAKKGWIDLKRDEPIDVSFDFSGWFTCLIAEQYDFETNEDRTFKEFFQHGDDMLKPVIKDFCEYMVKEQGHRNRCVHIYGEPRGHDVRTDEKPVFTKCVKYFNDCGWEAEILVEKGSKTDEHAVRYEDMNEAFSETDETKPRIVINADGCPNLIIALEATEVLPTFQKDKSKESDRDFPQENAPHLTDCKDYKYMQRYVQPANEIMRPSSAGIT